MKDRVPLYPGRVKLVPVSGQANTYDMERADQPTQVGDPLNKNTLLKDATAALFGLSSDAVPDDALALLSRFHKGLGNEYVWEKNKTEDVINYNIYQGPGTNANVCPTSSPRYIRFGTEFTVDDSNNFEILNPTDFYFSYSGSNLSELNVLAGKYYLVGVSDGDFSASLYLNKCESDSIPLVENSVVKMSNCTIYNNPSKTSKITRYGYVNSPDPNAYPPAVSDGYTYTPLGQMGAKVQVATGSYTGTGNAGIGSPNSLTFNFVPKLVVVGTSSGLYISSGNVIACFVWFSGVETAYVYNTANVFNLTDNTLSWYNSSNNADNQCNSSGETFHYVAIG